MVLIGYGCGTQSADWKVRDFSPPSWCRVYYILSGKVYYRCDGSRRLLKPGFLYIFPSYTSYMIDHEPEDPINCLWLHLNLYPIPVPELIEIEPADTLCCLLKALQIEVLRDSEDQRAGTSRLSMYSASAPLITSLSEAFLLYCKDRKYLNPPDEKIAPILQYIMEHYDKQLQLSEIGLRFGYSQEHLIRLFKKRIGITPHQYLIGCRMNQALLLLRQELTIHEIAQRCGYPDGKTFSNAFDHRYGISPSSFRKQLLKQP